MIRPDGTGLRLVLNSLRPVLIQQLCLHRDRHGLAHITARILHDDGDADCFDDAPVIGQQCALADAKGNRWNRHDRIGAY